MSGALSGFALIIGIAGAALVFKPKATLERITVIPLPASNQDFRVPRIAGYLLLFLSAFIIIFEFVSE